MYVTGDEHLGDDAEAPLPPTRGQALAAPTDQRHQQGHGALGVPAGPGGEACRRPRGGSNEHPSFRPDAGAAPSAPRDDRGDKNSRATLGVLYIYDIREANFVRLVTLRALELLHPTSHRLLRKTKKRYVNVVYFLVGLGHRYVPNIFFFLVACT